MIENKTVKNKKAFIRRLKNYKGVVLFIGNGNKNQYDKKQLNQLKKKLDSIVEKYNDKFNHNWIAIYGGDKDQGEENPDIGYLMGYLNHHHEIPLGMVINGHPAELPIQNDSTDSDDDSDTNTDGKKPNQSKKKRSNLVLYTEIEKDQNNQMLYGGIYQGHLVAATRVYLGDELIKPSSPSSSKVILSGIVSFGGGNIAFQEITYAFDHKIPITYVPANIGHQNPSEKDLNLRQYGPIYKWAKDNKSRVTFSPLE